MRKGAEAGTEDTLGYTALSLAAGMGHKVRAAEVEEGENFRECARKERARVCAIKGENRERKEGGAGKRVPTKKRNAARYRA